MMSQPKILARILFCALALAPPSAGLAVSALAEEPRVELRYDLRPGDHLTYHQVFKREFTGAKLSFLTRAAWTNHLLVTGEQNGSLVVGIQRNRTRAQLLSYKEGGRNRLSRQQPIFAQQLARRSPHFAEANLFDSRGQAKLPWIAVREWTSEVLFALHELEAVPDQSVGPSDSWTGTNPLGLEFRVLGWEELSGKRCLRVSGTVLQETLRLRYWFCPASATVSRLEFEGTYSVPGGQVREEWTVELVEQRRDELVQEWLARPELRKGVLAALSLSHSLPVEPTTLYAFLDSDDVAVQRQVLALAYRRRLRPPSLEQLAAVFESKDARVRTLCIRLLESVGKDRALPLIERALADSDYFVRQAALDWVRAHLPEENWDALTSPALRAPLSNTPIPPSQRSSLENCAETTHWSERVLWAQRFSWQPPGATLRGMTTESFVGRPYGVYVPEDYRSDQPFPLLIYLGGGSGRVTFGLLSSRSFVQTQGYLVVFPHANGWWWREEVTAMVTALLQEVLENFNVDTNRVYLAGFSNGGTGTLYFASYWADRLAAAVPLMAQGIYAPEAEPLLLTNLAGLPLLFLHGDRDNTIPVDSTHDTVRELRRVGHPTPLQVRILKGRGHDVTLARDAGLTTPFLQQHQRDPFPRKLMFELRDLQFPRRYWIEILEKDNGVAEVEGKISDGNTIRLKTRNVIRLRLLLRRELFPRSGPVRVLLNGKEVFAGVLPEDCELLQRSWKETADPFRAHSAELTFTVPR